MIMKILISIPIVAFGFYLFSLAIEHGNYPKPDMPPNVKRYEDLTSVISYLAIFALLASIWNS